MTSTTLTSRQPARKASSPLVGFNAFVFQRTHKQVSSLHRLPHGFPSGTNVVIPTTILPSRPNPFQDRVLFRIDLAEAGNVRLDLFDASGRRRRVLVNESMPAGAHQMVWDGRDDLSDDLPTGVYFARFKAGSVNKTMRVLRVR